MYTHGKMYKLVNPQGCWYQVHSYTTEKLNEKISCMSNIFYINGLIKAVFDEVRPMISAGVDTVVITW